MLRVEDLQAGYQKAVVLTGVSLEVDVGEVTTIVGPNGAGKTTLLRAISGQVRPTHGSVSLKGERIDGLAPYAIARRGITHCLERRRLFPEMTVRHNLDIGAYARKSKPEVKKDLQLVFALFPVLEERQDQIAGTLSGGQQQMLAIGRAIMAHPEVLLLDEPSLGLAPIVRRDIFRKIGEISESTTILMVEQDIAGALDIGDKFYSLQNGRIAFEGGREEMVRKVDLKRLYLGA